MTDLNGYLFGQPPRKDHETRSRFTSSLTSRMRVFSRVSFGSANPPGRPKAPLLGSLLRFITSNFPDASSINAAAEVAGLKKSSNPQVEQSTDTSSWGSIEQSPQDGQNLIWFGADFIRP